jgi:uncharacterized protein
MRVSTDFPSAGQAVLVLLALFLAEFVAGAALHDAGGPLGLTDGERDALVLLLGNAVVFSVLVQTCGLSYRELFHAAPSSLASTALLLVPPVLMLVPALVLTLAQAVDWLVIWFPLSRWEIALFERMGADTLPALVATCVLAPVLEEMLFRGVFLRAFLARYRRLPAIVAQAVLFGLAHLNLYQFVVGLVLGLLAGWLYERARSLVPCIALHAAYNGALHALPEDGPAVRLGAWVSALAAAALGALLLQVLLRRR